MSAVNGRTARIRKRAPVPECDSDRTAALGYEQNNGSCWIRCLTHGYPTPLARWHCHEELELHLITATSGRAFIGNWIGPFRPGHLVLCGPGLPHNWVSTEGLCDGCVSQRDLVIQFQQEPLMAASAHIPEFQEIITMLRRAQYGIEFFGISDAVQAHWHMVRNSHGIRRVSSFLSLLTDLAHCNDYHILSAPTQPSPVEGSIGQRLIQHTIDRITANIAHPVCLADLANEHGMSKSRFSRLFHRSMGCTLTEFIHSVRINNACQLLAQTDLYINDICYQVGFNNLANFNRRFLAIKGMTPSDYRRHTTERFGGSILEQTGSAHHSPERREICHASRH
ncbi:MAG: AraC family transcriptional regulator [Lautropia sp.]|nr:AraC family transcriptional regulator [Lautropia sp.]